MRIILPKLKPKQNRMFFQKTEFAEVSGDLNNPARGWYQIFPFYADEKPDFNRIAWCNTDKETLALVIINIGSFQDENISEAALGNMREILAYFCEKQFDVVLRITYDHEGYALEREPFFLAQVKEHMKQIAPLIKEFQEHIFVYQGMLIGNWGEMHTSKFVTPSRLKELWSVMKSEFGQEVFFAVRKPAFWRLLHPESCDCMQLPDDRMGLFDDAIFGSMTHLGTFGANPRENSGWDAQWNRESELEFEDNLCRFVPNGGEILSGESFLQESAKQQIIQTLKRMHVTYLNRDYDKVILDLWKEWNSGVSGIWQDKSLYDYIGAHLGYRFVVRDILVESREQDEESLNLTILIENVGFANCYQDLVAVLEWITEENQLYRSELSVDLCKCDSNTTIHIPVVFKAQKCYLYLSLMRRRDNRVVYFANATDQSGRVYLGRFLESKVR